MNDQTDTQLLRAYAEHRSDSAFAELVRRHVDMVHSAAKRMVCDAHLAQDVTQGVFLALASNAAQLTDRPVLSGWLHRTAQNIAAQTVRTDVRRRVREQEAATMNELLAAEPDALWEHIAPQLDTALGELSEADRDALLLRYFERKSASEMATTLGISEEAAQKRVNRAVERLREFFAKRGLSVGASGLVVVISANAVQAAPIGLAVTISTAAALAGTTIATTATATAIKTIAMTTLQKTLITATVVVAGVATPFVIQYQGKLREENQSLRQQVGQLAQLTEENERLSKLLTEAKSSLVLRLPAPPMVAVTIPAEAATDDSRSTNLIAKLLKGDEAPKLTLAQMDSYLKENRRSAASLLAAFRATGDTTLLQEAMEKFPDDPQVAFAAVFKMDASPEEQRQWLETFKRSSPENVLASYLSAFNYFKSGQTDQAVQELVAASDKRQFRDYTTDFVQNDEEAWRAAGYSVTESKTIASMTLLLPHLGQLKNLSQDMVSLANSYRQAGDEASAQAALEMGFNLGQRLDGSPGQALINQLVGMAIQGIALRAMDPASAFGGAGQTVKDQLDELTRQRAAIRELTAQFDGAQRKMSEQDWISYKDRWRAFGEESALRWMVNKYGPR